MLTIVANFPLKISYCRVVALTREVGTLQVSRSDHVIMRPESWYDTDLSLQSARCEPTIANDLLDFSKTMETNLRTMMLSEDSLTTLSSVDDVRLKRHFDARTWEVVDLWRDICVCVRTDTFVNPPTVHHPPPTLYVSPIHRIHSFTTCESWIQVTYSY